MSGWIDIHCHCLPGVDDGPATLSESLELCRQLVDSGVAAVIATPHQLGRYEGRNSATQIRSAVANLQIELDRASIPLRVHPGGEVRIDPGVATLLQRDRVLSLGDTKTSLLLELPLEIDVNPVRLIDQLQKQNVRTIIAHAERYAGVVRSPDAVLNWIAAGACLQVNADSLLGNAGSSFEACAWELLRRGLVSMVASDAHDPIRRRPRIAEVASILAHEIGASPARQLLRENPQRVLSGEPIVPVTTFADGRS